MTISLAIARDLHRQGKLEQAESAYRDLLSTGVSEAEPLLGIVLLQRDQPAAAHQLLQPLSDRNPDDAELAINASLAARLSGEGEIARTLASRAVANAPDKPGAWNALALADMVTARYDEALETLETGLQRHPGVPALQLHRGQCLAHLGRRNDAIAAFTELLQGHPDMLEAWRGLARVFTAAGRTGDALQCRARARALRPDSPELWLELGVAQLHAGQLTEAFDTLDRLVKAQPGNTQAWEWLGRCQLKRGDRTAARASFERSLALGSDDPTVRHLLAALHGELPVGIEDDYIRELFDDFADRFDETLVSHLHYSIPDQLKAHIHALAGEHHETILDLGCGTGLMAIALAGEGNSIDGVDLSTRMLDHARRRGIYRSLHAEEALRFLEASEDSWSLIVAADVFVYIADLQPVFNAASQRIKVGGTFAFSIEASTSETTELPPETGRYRHSRKTCEEALSRSGFGIIDSKSVTVRLENDTPVDGWTIVARRAPADDQA